MSYTTIPNTVHHTFKVLPLCTHTVSPIFIHISNITYSGLQLYFRGYLGN